MNSHHQHRQRLEQKTHQTNLEHFQARLTARLCVIFIAISQLIQRTVIICTEPGLTKDSQIAFLISLPFLASIALIVVIEYLLFKKLGPRIIAYSKYVEILLSLLFMGEWLSSLVSSLERVSSTRPPSFGISALFGYTAFAWRTLLLTFLLHHWQLKIIAPTAALAVAMGYSIHYSPKNTLYILMRGIVQILDVIVLFYCEDKIKWRVLFTNLQQEKWVRINEFILNNIPENIMILDINCQPKFISDYCAAFLKKCHLYQNKTDLFACIKDISQFTDAEPLSPSFISTNTNKHTFAAGFCDPLNKSFSLLKIDTLQDLLNNFKLIIKQKSLLERQFLMYNGKLRVEGHPDKAIEIKISFILQDKKEYIILIFRDTTQRDLLITLEDNNKYKDYLLASVSHELRAPLNGNINLVETAINTDTVPKTIKETLLIPALRSSKFLLHLINDILDMSQIKARKLRLVFQTGNLQDTLRDALQLVELQARKKGILLTLDVDSRLKKNFCTDHMRLSQIVLNLLHNAIKFTQKGEVKLSASLPEETSCGAKICIEDSGMGINQENIKKLFADFTRIDFEGRDIINPNGVGLGLNIAYNLSVLLGSEKSLHHSGIHVESIPNKGSVFTFIIEDKEAEILEVTTDAKATPETSEVVLVVPEEVNLVIERDLSERIFSYRSPGLLLPLEKKLQSESPLLTSESECACAKILIVDDNPFNTMAFETVLASLNLKCDVVYNGQASIEKVLERQNHPCSRACNKAYKVIFMDKEMPEMNGIEAVNEIRRLQAENVVGSTNIVGCTAHGSKEEVDKFLESGLNECIHKPISVSLIQRVLEKYEFYF